MTGLGVLGLWWTLTASAAPLRQSSGAGASVSGNPAQLRAAGVAALARGRSDEARRAFEQAYQQRAEDELLFLLGEVARVEHRGVEAADLHRRYLERGGAAVPPERRQRIERDLLALSADTVDVFVSGDHVEGALLFVDGRLVGALPLALPLLLRPGQRALRLTQGRRTVATTQKLTARRPAKVRFSLTSSLTVWSLTRAALLQIACEGEAAQRAGKLEHALREAAAEVGVLLLQREAQAQLLTTTPALSACVKDGRCPVALGPEADVPYLLRVRCEQSAAAAPARPGAMRQTSTSDYRFQLALEDLTISALAAEDHWTCARCSEAQALAGLRRLTPQLLTQATSRPRGRLQITAKPKEALAYLDGRKLAETPFALEALAGEHALRLERPGSRPYTAQITIPDRDTLLLKLRLQSLPRPARALQIMGWSLLAAGLLSTAAGITLWALDGDPSLRILKEPCPSDANKPSCFEDVLGRQSALGPLIGGGVALGVGGLLLGLDARRESARNQAQLTLMRSF